MTKFAISSLRFTLFISRSEEIDVRPEAWWEIAVGEQPEDIRFQPRLQRYEANTAFENGRLFLRIEGNRIDWRLAADEKSPIELKDIDEPLTADLLPAFPIIGSYRETQDKFVDLVKKWQRVEIVPLADRMAYGAMLAIPAEGHAEGYRLLQKYLHNVKLDPEGSSDFLYQINRPRNHQFHNQMCKINRLSKWSVVALRTHKFQVSELGAVFDPPLSSSFSANVEMDINTAGDFAGNFDTARQAEIFSTLVEYAEEIAENGDIK